MNHPSSSSPSPLDTNVLVDDSKSDVTFADVGMLAPKFSEQNNDNNSPKMMNTITNAAQQQQQQQQQPPLQMVRKLIRTDSTYEDDSFDESIRDLSHLSHQRYVLRQQWFRKNNLVSRLRRSTSTASNSSSSSSGISSNIYSSSGNSNANSNTSSSFASSFSSSFSATLSSLSESCDNDSNYPSNITASENDYPKILRKSSFKNKLIHCYKPYGRPRRYSLQLLKNNLEFPENLKLFSTKGTNFHLPRASSSMMKYSSSCYSLGQKEKRCIYSMVAASPTSAVKSNPSSPNKNQPQMDYVAHPSHHQQSNDISNVMTTSPTQLIVDLAGQTEPNQSGNNNLIRSKSLDDLQTLFCCPNYCGTINNFCSSSQVGYNILASSTMNQLGHQQQQQQHYASFNRICDPSLNHHNQPESGPTTATTTNNNNIQCSYFSTNQLTPMMGCFNGNQMKAISISSQQINGNNLTASGNNNNNNNNTTNNNSTILSANHHQQQQPPTNTNNNNENQNDNNNSLCDIEHVMKKISSLRV